LASKQDEYRITVLAAEEAGEALLERLVVACVPQMKRTEAMP